MKGVQETHNTRRNRQPVGGVYAGVQETANTNGNRQRDGGEHAGVQETHNTRRNRQPVDGVYAGVQETQSTSDNGQYVGSVHADDVVDLPLPDLPGYPRAGQARNALGNYSGLRPGIVVLCKTDAIPVYIRSPYIIYDRIVVLNIPKHEVVPSGNRLRARTFAVIYGMRSVKWSQWSY